MPKPKGSPKSGGRGRGVPNKITRDMRAAIALIVERNVGELEKWLAEVARTDPAKAADLFLRICEYHVPKLARTELLGGGGITVQLMRFSDAAGTIEGAP